MQFCDPVVLHVGQQPGFFAKPPNRLFHVAAPTQHLQRHHFAGRHVDAAIHVPHAARSGHRTDAVTSQHRALGQRFMTGRTQRRLHQRRRMIFGRFDGGDLAGLVGITGPPAGDIVEITSGRPDRRRIERQIIRIDPGGDQFGPMVERLSFSLPQKLFDPSTRSGGQTIIVPLVQQRLQPPRQQFAKVIHVGCRAGDTATVTRVRIGTTPQSIIQTGVVDPHAARLGRDDMNRIRRYIAMRQPDPMRRLDDPQQLSGDATSRRTVDRVDPRSHGNRSRRHGRQSKPNATGGRDTRDHAGGR